MKQMGYNHNVRAAPPPYFLLLSLVLPFLCCVSAYHMPLVIDHKWERLKWMHTHTGAQWTATTDINRQNGFSLEPVRHGAGTQMDKWTVCLCIVLVGDF